MLESLRTTRDTEGKPLWDGKAEVIWRLATDAEFPGPVMSRIIRFVESLPHLCSTALQGFLDLGGEPI